MADEGFSIKWGGRTFTVGQLTVADVIAMEEEFGLSFFRIDFASVKAIAWLVWLVRRHDEPDLNLDDVTEAAFASMLTSAEGEDDEAVPPPSASSKRGAKPAKSGARRGRTSSGSSRGTSSD